MTTTGGPTRVLVVEDERTIAAAVGDRLRAEGFEVTQVYDGPAAVATAATWAPDLIVLDVMLPGFDGHEVCRRVQADRPVPVLMLTARDDETDVLVGLGVGADDYLTKPFSMRELVARVRVHLRIDQAQRRVRRQGEAVHLTRTEFDLLACLAARPGTVLSRERLLSEVWDWQDAAGTRTVDSHVKSLRSKLGAGRLRTVHGVGYALEVMP